MYGWQGRIGFIGPPMMAETVPYEFYRVVPDGVALVVTCMGLHDLQPDEIDKVLGLVEDHVKELTRRKVDIMVLGGTPLILSRGAGFENELIAQAQRLTDIKVTTSTTAALHALNVLGAKKLVSVTTYHEFRNKLFKEYLEAQGFEVLNVKGLGLHIADIHELPAETSYRLAKQAFLETPGADAIYMPCAQLATLFNIDLLEKELEVPILTSTQAWLWETLSYLRIHNLKMYPGKLFKMLDQGR